MNNQAELTELRERYNALEKAFMSLLNDAEDVEHDALKGRDFYLEQAGLSET